VGGILTVAHEVNRPTYETVGSPERFDEGDNLFAEARPTPGNPEEQAHHASHPDSYQIDLRLATFIQQKTDKRSCASSAPGVGRRRRLALQGHVHASGAAGVGQVGISADG